MRCTASLQLGTSQGSSWKALFRLSGWWTCYLEWSLKNWQSFKPFLISSSMLGTIPRNDAGLVTWLNQSIWEVAKQFPIVPVASTNYSLVWKSTWPDSLVSRLSCCILFSFTYFFPKCIWSLTPSRASYWKLCSGQIFTKVSPPWGHLLQKSSRSKLGTIQYIFFRYE